MVDKYTIDGGASGGKWAFAAAGEALTRKCPVEGTGKILFIVFLGGVLDFFLVLAEAIHDLMDVFEGLWI